MDGSKVFHNRQDAGHQLATQLEKYKIDSDAIVLGLPRGGVPVAYEVAQRLNLLLDIFVVRKLGVPFQEELAMGAIASGGASYFNNELVSQLHLSQDDINAVLEKEKAELLRREKKYREGKALPDLSNKTVILVDDGIATGASTHAAILALKKLSPKKIIVAVPVAPESNIDEISSMVDEFVCIYPAPIFYGVGQFYEDFSQTQDSEVQYLLQQSRESK